MEEAQKSKKRKIDELYPTRLLKEKRDQSIYRELVSGRLEKDIMDKYQIGRERIYAAKKKFAIQEVIRQKRQKAIAYRLNLTVEQVRKYRNDYIYTSLAKTGDVASLVAELQMSKEQILKIRDKRIANELIKGLSFEEVAKDAQLPIDKIRSIRDEQIIERLKEEHPEEIARDFKLSMEQVYLVKQRSLNSNSEISDSSITIKDLLEQLEERKTKVLSLLEEGKATKDVAQELMISQRTVIDIRNREIEKSFENKQDGKEISQRFHIEIEELYRLRDVRVLMQNDQGKTSTFLSERFNVSRSRVGSIVSRNNSSSKIKRTKASSQKIPDISTVSEEKRQEILKRIKETDITKTLGEELKVIVPLIYKVRNDEILKKLNRGEHIQGVADEFKMNIKNVREVIFRGNLAEFPNIKRRTLDYLTPEQAKTIRNYINRRMSIREISEALDIKASLIRSVKPK
ncbi:LuxR C-terminal-related transcriptional regulator [Candidatus Enterococcus mangumiae]|uniref:HTH luxR-type domain-containing protein n=1 Tax=Candidatus Enterococcus mangumiae TaxID=2230878 RepID=A0ABZ2SZX3_9ENTE|nr:LuxR C-terminal-related transcriptional regulator [Enterococcus sp. DIV1094]MBO0489870.1 response regulator transcription factor [Enterococcus sp. DIV1094]